MLTEPRAYMCIYFIKLHFLVNDKTVNIYIYQNFNIKKNTVKSFMELAFKKPDI